MKKIILAIFLILFKSNVIVSMNNRQIDEQEAAEILKNMQKNRKSIEPDNLTSLRIHFSRTKVPTYVPEKGNQPQIKSDITIITPSESVPFRSIFTGSYNPFLKDHSIHTKCIKSFLNKK